MTPPTRGVFRDELIGLKAKILRSPDYGLVGKVGVIVDETKNVIVLDVKGREVVIPKKGLKLLVNVNTSKEREILGEMIQWRPEDRIKKKSR